MKSISPERIHRILIRATNWVGDAVMSIPAMREVRTIFPGAHISLLVRPWVRDVYGAVDFVDAVVEFDKSGPHKGWRGLGSMAAELRQQKYDLAILLQNAFEAALIAWLARIPLRLGYSVDCRGLLLTHPCKIDPRVRSVHQAYYYLGILAGAGLIDSGLWENPQYPLQIEIGLREQDRRQAKALLLDRGVRNGEIVIGFNPGAFYGGAKRWLTERYAAVADALIESHKARVAIFGSASDRAVADDMARHMKHDPLVFAGETTLGQLMGLIRECTLFVTNDSGPMHLAAALDVPQLAIFGSTSEVATGPLSPKAEVLKNTVDCNPCFLRECPVDFRCMTGLTVEAVLESAEKKLERILGAAACED